MNSELYITDRLQVLKLAFGALVGGGLAVLLLTNVFFPLSFETETSRSVVGTGSTFGDIIAFGICAGLFYVAVFRNVHTITITGSMIDLKRIGGTRRAHVNDIISIKRGLGGYAYTLRTKSGTLFISSGFKGLYLFLEFLRNSDVESTEW